RLPAPVDGLPQLIEERPGVVGERLDRLGAAFGGIDAGAAEDRERFRVVADDDVHRARRELGNRQRRERASASCHAQTTVPAATSPAISFATLPAISANAAPAGESGCASAVGSPASPASRTFGSSGTSPRSGTFMSSASLRPPP